MLRGIVQLTDGQVYTTDLFMVENSPCGGSGVGAAERSVASPLHKATQMPGSFSLFPRDGMKFVPHLP